MRFEVVGLNKQGKNHAFYTFKFFNNSSVLTLKKLVHITEM